MPSFLPTHHVYPCSFSTFQLLFPPNKQALAHFTMFTLSVMQGIWMKHSHGRGKIPVILGLCGQIGITQRIIFLFQSSPLFWEEVNLLNFVPCRFLTNVVFFPLSAGQKRWLFQKMVRLLLAFLLLTVPAAIMGEILFSRLLFWFHWLPFIFFSFSRDRKEPGDRLTLEL